VKQQIENVRRIRAQQRQRREVGSGGSGGAGRLYERGKSTLFNVLTKSKVLGIVAEFATLDPTIRGRSCIEAQDSVLGHGRFHTASAHTLVSAFANAGRSATGDAHSASLGCEQSGVGGAGRAGWRAY